MKRATILLAFLFLGCGRRDPSNVSNSAGLGCQVYTFEGRKFVVCDTFRGVTMAPLDSCK